MCVKSVHIFVLNCEQNCVKPTSFTKACPALHNVLCIGWVNTHRLVRDSCTAFPQALGIKALLYVTDVLADYRIKSHFLFDLVDRVDGGCVIFSTELTSDFRKTKVQLAS